MSVTIAPLTSASADAVLAIYQAGTDEGTATFEIAPHLGAVRGRRAGRGAIRCRSH